ncbi:MAG: rod shape-determining protein MreC [Candidatus Cloacimonetes bacterium]|nr:rod shape-determining protein MreC [Candidatus Cloacimonadota bacterium]MBL7086844.1 rod shape-determining protein MreC [Candidatus Cloacimonadota bacterium]
MFNRKNIIFVIFLIISLIFIAGNTEDRITKAQLVGKYFLLPYTASISYFKSLSKLSQKNLELKKELFILQSANRQFKEEILRSARLSNIFDIQNKRNLQIEVARIIGTSSFLNYETLIIDAGKNRDIKINLPVISTQGLVGKTIAVYPTHSVVQTFGSKYFRMGGLDSRSRIHGIVGTDLDGKIYLQKIKVGSDIKLGDKIVTSKLSSIFPPEIPFGKIINIEQTSEGLFTKARISPFVNLANLEDVAIITVYEQ